MATEIPYDIFVIISDNLISHDIFICALTCKSWYRHTKHPSFWRDLILRHYPYDVKDAQHEDYEFLRHLSFLSVTKPTLQIPSIFKGKNLHQGTNSKIIKELEDEITTKHKIATTYLKFLIKKEIAAWANGEDLKHYIVNPDYYKNNTTLLYLRFKNLPIPAYTAMGALLKIHHYTPRNGDGFDFITDLIDRYHHCGLNMDILHRCIIVNNVAPRSRFNNKSFFIMQKLG